MVTKTETQFLVQDSIPWAYLTPSPPLYWPNSTHPTQLHPRNPHLPKSPLNRFFIGLTRVRTSMHVCVCRQQCMRFILRTRQFKDFLKPPSKLNDDEYDFTNQMFLWILFWKCCGDEFIGIDCINSQTVRMTSFAEWGGNIDKRRHRDGSTERLGKSPKNKLGKMFFYVVQLWLTIRA